MCSSPSAQWGLSSTGREFVTDFLLRARSFGGLCVDIEYGYATGNDSYKAQSVRASVRMPF